MGIFENIHTNHTDGLIEKPNPINTYYQGETEEEFSESIGGFPTEKDANRLANAFNHLKEFCDKSDPFN